MSQINTYSHIPRDYFPPKITVFLAYYCVCIRIKPKYQLW